MFSTQFKLISELSEKQIEADVATYFGWITPEGIAPFRLVDIPEQHTGADKKFDWVIPIYMQFKVAHGLAPISRFDPRFSPLRRIQKFRAGNQLFHNPTLYFKLHDLARNATDYQHNVLYTLANTPNVHAFYVAPLTLHKKEYDELLFNSLNRYLLHPFFYYREQKIRNAEYITSIRGLPYLRGHVSILPHEKIRSADHYYSFSPSGTDIAWHSPQLLSDSVNRLSDVLSRIISLSLGQENWVSIQQYTELMSDLENKFRLEPQRREESIYRRFTEFGNKLLFEYGIRQFLLVATDEELFNLKRH